MAYVGTGKWKNSDRYTLASIIAGEAGNEGEAGMNAVAAVMANRARQNFSGYGTSVVAQATARRQFQGQSTPTAASYAVADKLLAGQIVDNTGGALYYANPGDSTARWARNLNTGNALKIGNHYFTDNANGRVFSGNGATGSLEPLFLDENGRGVMADGSVWSGGGPMAGGGTDLGTLHKSPTQNDGSLPWEPTKVGATSVNPNSSDLTQATDTQTIQQAASATEQAKAIIAAATQQAATDAATNKATLESAGGWLSQTQGWLGNWLVRGFIILLGLIFIGGALGLLIWKGQDALPEVVTK